MTVEAALTRRLGITFMDARAIATESKLNLQITGYPTPEQKERLINEAIRLFESKSPEEQKSMKVTCDSFEQTKMETGSRHGLLSLSSHGNNNNGIQNHQLLGNDSSHHESSSYSNSEDFSECSSVVSETPRKSKKKMLKAFVTSR